MASKKRDKCSGCGLDDCLISVLEFGKIPLAGYFPDISQIRDTNDYNCNLLFCDNCGLLQVDTIVDETTLFKDYRYMSSIGLSGHFKEVAGYLEKRFRLKENNSKVLEIGSNDGVLLKPFGDLGVDAIGFDPSENISKVAKEKGCKIIIDFFNAETARKSQLGNSIDLVVANNVFAHINDLDSVIDGIKYCLKKDGSFVAEVHYLLNLVNQNQYDFIYHEHLFYHSLFGLNNLFHRHGMTVYDFDLIDVHSGSIRIFVKKKIEELPVKIIDQISKEEAAGITTSKGFRKFSFEVTSHIKLSNDMIDELISEGRSIVGFGASGRCNILCNLLRLGTERIKYIFDESPERINRFIPKANIPIIKFDAEAAFNVYDIVLIFAWNYSNMIMKKIKAKQYCILFPSPKILDGGTRISGIL